MSCIHKLATGALVNIEENEEMKVKRQRQCCDPSTKVSWSNGEISDVRERSRCARTPLLASVGRCLFTNEQLAQSATASRCQLLHSFQPGLANELAFKKTREQINFFAKLVSCCLFNQLLPTGCVPQPVRWRKHHWVRLLCVRCVRRPVCSLCLRKHGGGTRPQLSWSLGC